MKFLGLSLINHTPDPLTGHLSSTTERFREVVDSAVLFEQLGFDGFGVGERHHRPFISTSPPVVLAHIAALTSEIRLFSAVTLLSILDPVRVAEDYATLDHLSNGRLEVIIGKGNGPEQAELFGLHAGTAVGDDQRELPAAASPVDRGAGDLERTAPTAVAGCDHAAASVATPTADLARQRNVGAVGRPRRRVR